MSLNINIFSVHYFLWFAALTSIYGYYSSYAEEYANASASQYGLLNMILPFASILAKVFFCSLADRHRAYRSFFVWFLLVALIGFGSFAILPFFVKPQPKEAGLNLAAWISICIMVSLSTISMSVISCLSDSFAMNSSIKNNTTYGRIRLWGTLGWGLASITLTFINDYKGLPLLVPGLILMVVLLVCDILAQCFWHDKEDYNLDKSCADAIDFEVIRYCDQHKESGSQLNRYGTTDTLAPDLALEIQSTSSIKISSFHIQWLLFVKVAQMRKSLFHYMALFTFSGALISLQWSYFFVYLNRIYKNDFAFITALSMVGQSFIGELPFFILSNYILNLLGKSHTLSLSFIALESLQGPSFGLFYVVMTEVGLDYSECEAAIALIVEKGIISNRKDNIEKLRQALRATMQSLMSACYEGLGLGIGSILGGLVIDYCGFSSLWFWSSIISTLLGIANFAVHMCSKS